MVGIHKAVALFQVEYLVNLSGKDQTVATHQELIVGHGRHNLAVVEMLHFDERTATDLLQPSLFDGLADMVVV